MPTARQFTSAIRRRLESLTWADLTMASRCRSMRNEIPVFWACGVTPQAVAERTRVDFMITHEPAQMFVTDLRREG